MKKNLCCLLILLAFGVMTWTIQAEENDGFVSIFNGKNLDGWDGNPNIWSVEDGCIVGVTGAKGEKNHLTYNQFLIWRDGEVEDFILKFDIWLSKDGNSGMQFRSWEDVDNKEQPYRVYGYQGDFDGAATYSGILYGENFRGILAQRGQESEIGDDHKPKEVRRFSENEELKKKIKIEDWNTYEITAKGYTITEKINGVVTSICTDNDKEVRRNSGILAIQAHVGPPMKVKVKNILLKRLPTEGKKN